MVCAWDCMRPGRDMRPQPAAGPFQHRSLIREGLSGILFYALDGVGCYTAPAGDAPIVITERRDGPPDTPRAPGPALTDAPLLVLVNSHTASASEIVAGALHDNCRAVLAGGRTYGKGLIQSVYELSDGSGLVITVGKYLTPSGTDIDRCGGRSGSAVHVRGRQWRFCRVLLFIYMHTAVVILGVGLLPLLGGLLRMVQCCVRLRYVLPLPQGVVVPSPRTAFEAQYWYNAQLA